MRKYMTKFFYNYLKTWKLRVSGLKKSPALLSILICAFVGIFSGAGDQTIASDITAVQYPDSQIVVTYFYTDFRCPTCMKLETYSQETVEKNFSKELQAEALVFRTLNMDKPENKHYIKAYNLYTKSLVVTHTKDGNVIRWKNLPDIWKLVRDRAQFEAYVRSEVLAFLKDL